ncbi:TolC family outer membrane protein [Halomonas piscis]|uniref:TolC family outer membrane protein n=1 Tax=Halomonas piscis TaxID=3031727 RepID=A0ABY9Z280_9GAMM|nr:TolC family outer membrane protein [Halomonas piscis]WNK21195.1 TolC family outer membrane protein [Halomonas piscis]
MQRYPTRTPRCGNVALLTRAVALAGLLASTSLYAQKPQNAPDSGSVKAGDAAMAEFNALEQAAGEARAAPRLPSLPDLFARALEYDAKLSEQRYELEATREEKPIARSQLLPQLNASGGYMWQDTTNVQTERDDDPRTTSRPGEFTEDYWRVQLSQPLFSLERWRKLDVAEAQINAAELKLATAERDLALSVSEAYVKAYLASQRLGLLNSQQESLELQQRQASRAYELGVGNRVDLLESRSRLDQAIADTVEAQNELDNALSELERLTGTRPDMSRLALSELDEVVLKRQWEDSDEWIERTGKNLDVRRARKEQQVTEADTSTRRAGYYPELNMNLSYSDRHSEDDLRTSEDYTAQMEVSMPLYQGGRTNARVRQGEKRIRAGQAAVDNQRNLAVQQVRKSLRSINGGVRRLDALREAIESSQLFLEAAQRGEQLGLRDLVDVLDARASLYDQRIKYVDTLGSYALDRLRLQSAVGDLNSDDLADIMGLLASMTTGAESSGS